MLVKEECQPYEEVNVWYTNNYLHTCNTLIIEYMYVHTQCVCCMYIRIYHLII